MSKMVALAALVLALGATVAAAKGPAVPPGSTYVAMGSSYAAGPGVTQPTEASVCNRSQDNYAHQLARMRKLRLIDRGCGGAVTGDLLHAGQFGLPAQLDGLTPDSRLVTMTIGGNDVRYMADLGVDACAHQGLGRCPQPATGFDMEAAFAGVATNLKTIVAEIHKRSPQARVVIVDYVTVLPAGPPCPKLALSQAEADGLRARAERLAKLTATVAAETHTDLVKASELSRGHDACAADPWVQGYALKANPTDWGPVAFHPLLAAHTAIAKALDKRLDD